MRLAGYWLETFRHAVMRWTGWSRRCTETGNRRAAFEYMAAGSGRWSSPTHHGQLQLTGGRVIARGQGPYTVAEAAEAGSRSYGQVSGVRDPWGRGSDGDACRGGTQRSASCAQRLRAGKVRLSVTVMSQEGE